MLDESLITHLKQNDSRWGGDFLGHGASCTIGGEGCEETAFTVGVNAMNGTALTPRDVNEKLKAIPNAMVRLTKDSFGQLITVPGPLIVLEAAARAYGLQCPNAMRLRSHPGDPALGKLLCETLDQDGMCAIVHVDINGDGVGDHFVLAFGREGGLIKLSDPAPGGLRFVDDVNLEGTSDWAGTLKKYHVVGVAPFWK